MSVANIRFDGETVTFYTDTMAYRDNEPLRLTEPKAHIADNGMFAWTFRGQTEPARIIGNVLCAAPTVAQAEQHAAELMKGIAADLLTTRGLELHLAGWSAQHGAMRLVRLVRRPEDFTAAVLGPDVYLNPKMTDKVAVPLSASDAVLVKVAMYQWQVHHTRDLRMCIGGSLWRTVVTKDGASQGIADLYPDYDEHAARFGDPCADAVAAVRAGQRKAA